MRKSIYEELRKNMDTKLASLIEVSSKNQTDYTDKSNQEILKLRNLFAQLISSKKALFSEFEDLIVLKNQIYQTLLSLYFAIIYQTSARRELQKFNMLLELFDIYNSSEFSRKISGFLQYLYDNNLEDARTSFFQNYFRLKFNEIERLLYPGKTIYLRDQNIISSQKISVYYSFITKDDTVVLENGDRYLDIDAKLVETKVSGGSNLIKSFSIVKTVEPTIGDLWFDPEKNILYEAILSSTWENAKYEIIESSIDDPENPEYFLLFSLWFMGFTDKNSPEFNFSRITVYSNYLTTSNENMTNIIFNSATKYIKSIKDYLQSFLYIEDYRKKNDNTYFDKYIKNIYEKFEAYNELLNFSTSVTSKTIEDIKENGIYNTIILEMTNLESLIKTLMDEIIDSLKEINPFIESYSPFLKLPIEKMSSLENTLFNILPKMNLDISSELDFTYINYLKIVPFSIGDWITRIVNKDAGLIIYKDYYTLVLLYVGLFLRSNFSVNYQNLKYSNYALNKLLNSRNIANEVGNINNAFLDIESGEDTVKKIEKNLAASHALKVLKNPNNEMISSTLKLVIPELSILDNLDFSSLFELETDLTSLNWFTALEGLNKVLYITILKSMLKNKKNIKKKLLSILTMRKNRTGLNLKDIYIENVLKKVIGDILSKTGLDPSEDDFVNLNQYSTSFIFDILNDYKLVWQTFYKDDQDFFETMLKNNGNLKEALL